MKEAGLILWAMLIVGAAAGLLIAFFDRRRDRGSERDR